MRRSLAALAALLLSLFLLTACGEDSDGSSSAGSGNGLDSVTIEGEVGEAPEVTFDGEVEVGDLESEVISEGDGEEVVDGDTVKTHIWIANGFTQEEVYNTYADEAPQTISVNDRLSEAIRVGIEGHPLGSRVAVASSATDAFGEMGNPQLGIGNKDSVVFVIDVVEKLSTEPSGTEQEPAPWVPELQESDGAVTGFDFSGAPEPGTKLQVSTLIKGDGAKVESGQTITVNYLGQVYGGDAPFDESYSAGAPVSFGIGTGQVIKGWDQALVGQTVGSRVVMSIPPTLGYGKQGNEQAGIKGTDTLYFVVDILAAE